jgi:cell division protein FtsA
LTPLDSRQGCLVSARPCLSAGQKKASCIVEPVGIIAVLDIGTSKISAAVAEVAASGTITVIGAGRAENAGIRSGVVVDLEATSRSIRAAADAAESQSGYKIEQAIVSVSGRHLESQTTSGQVAVRGTNREVTAEDISRVLEIAQAVELPATRELLHVLPGSYTLDGQEGVLSPLGMSALRLEVRTHLVTASAPAINNLAKAVKSAGIDPVELVAAPLATAMATTTESERMLGAAVIDVGAGTTDVALYSNGVFTYLASIPVGGEHIVRDVAVGLRLGLHEARRVVEEAGTVVLRQPNAESGWIELDGIAPIRRVDLARIMEARSREIFELAAREIGTASPEAILGGTIISGGVASITGMASLVADVVGTPTRVAAEFSLYGLTDKIGGPAYAGTAGLLAWGAAGVEAGESTTSGSIADRVSTFVRSVAGRLGRR